MADSPRRRDIRSFVVRTGRMTASQQRAWEFFWPRWGLTVDAGRLRAEQVFGRRAPLVMEIGFGMGRSLAQMALASPAVNWLGVEVYKPGVGRLLHTLAEQGSDNVRIYCADAVAVVRQCLADAVLDGVQIYFPDPWPKQRHHKRRLVQAGFVQLLADKIKPGGYLHLVTDWENYAAQMLALLEAAPEFSNRAVAEQYSPRPDWRPLTKFEQRGLGLGHEVRDLLFDRC